MNRYLGRRHTYENDMIMSFVMNYYNEGEVVDVTVRRGVGRVKLYHDVSDDSFSRILRAVTDRRNGFKREEHKPEYGDMLIRYIRH